MATYPCIYVYDAGSNTWDAARMRKDLDVNGKRPCLKVAVSNRFLFEKKCDHCTPGGGHCVGGRSHNPWYLGSNIVTSSGSLQDTFLYLLVSNSAPIVRAQDKGARIFGPPTLPWLFWRGGAWSGVPGVGARCGNGLFSTYKSPKILS